MSKVIVYSTTGKTGTIETSATTWGELQRELSNQGFSSSGMKTITGDKQTLEHPEAKLPTSDFNLFMLPVKTKSGAFTVAQIEAMPYSQLRAELKQLSDANKDKFAKHFNGGKNYTTKSTDVLKSLFVSYIGAKAGKATPATATPTTPTKASPKATTKQLPATAAELPVKKVKETAKTLSATTKVDNGSANVVKSVAESKSGSNLPAMVAAPIVISNQAEKLDLIAKLSASIATGEPVTVGTPIMVAAGEGAPQKSALVTEKSDLQAAARKLASNLSGIGSF